MSEFAITPMYQAGFELTVRCQVWQIRPDSGDELTTDDIAFWKRIETVLNANAMEII